MERNINAIMPGYPDVIPTHPDWTEEDYEKHIAEEMEKANSLSEWPDI